MVDFCSCSSTRCLPVFVNLCEADIHWDDRMFYPARAVDWPIQPGCHLGHSPRART